MIRGLLYGIKKFWSEITSGDLLILSLAIVLSVTAISSVGFLGDRLQSSMKQQAASILGADVTLRSASELGSDYLELAKIHELETAETVSFLSMAIANEDNLLSSIKATTSSYPLKGALIISTVNGDKINHKGSPRSGYLWVEKKILEVLELRQSSQLIIGNKTFIVEGIIQEYPDRNSGFFGFYPTIIVNADDLAEMGIIQTGSRVVYRNLFAGTGENIKNFLNSMQDMPAEIRVQKAEDAGEGLGKALESSTIFFNLASLFTIIISVITSMMAVRRYAARNLLQTSLMKVFGASKRFILGSQIMQLTLMALLATLVGLLGGYLLQFLLISALQDIINTDLPPPSFQPVILGFVASFCVVFGVASPYLKILSESEPIRILRNDFSIGMTRNLMIYLVASATMLIFLMILFKNIELILYIVGALIAVTIALFLIGKGLIYGLSFMQLSSGIGWKLGLKNIAKRGHESILQIVIFGLSLVFLLVLAETRTDLIDSWTDRLQEDTPNNFLFNIQEYDLENISEYLGNTADISPVFTPLIRGRLLSVKRASTELLDSENVMEREANLTWQEKLPDSNTIVQGSWWEAGSLRAEVSVDDSIADSMNLALGDELYFSAGGTNFYATVTSFREVSWESFSPNFFFLLSPAIGKTLPNSYITSIRIPENSSIITSFIERFPTITNIDIGAVIKQVQNTISSASLAVQYIFILALAAGILALIASIFSNTDQRKKEAAILHAIGAKRSLIFQAAAAEFLVLGVLSAMTAIIAAILLSGVIFTQVLELSYSPNPYILGSGFLAAVIFIFLAGIISIRKTIYTSPMLTLKDA